MTSRVEEIRISFRAVDESIREDYCASIQKLLFTYGYEWQDTGVGVVHMDDYYTYIGLRTDKSIFKSKMSGDNTVCVLRDMDKIMKVLEKNQKIIVNLNSEYSAECRKDGFKVGCQSFNWGVLDKLVSAKNKLNT